MFVGLSSFAVVSFLRISHLISRVIQGKSRLVLKLFVGTCVVMARCNASLFSSVDLDEGFPVMNLVAYSAISSLRPTQFADLYLHTSQVRFWSNIKNSENRKMITHSRNHFHFATSFVLVHNNKSNTEFDGGLVISRWCWVRINCSVIASSLLAFTVTLLPITSLVSNVISAS